MGGQRGKLISQADRAEAIKLIDAACAAGARKMRACEILDISLRTLERWKKDTGTLDKRKGANKIIGNKLPREVRKEIIAISNSNAYRDLPPCKIVPLLADKDCYIASESSFYRVLREKKQLKHRLKSKRPAHKKPEPYTATNSNEVWSWDITYLPSQVKGIYFYLYLFMDVYSRKIVGWTIHEEESASHAANLIQQICIDEKVDNNQVVLHSDNGSPMKGLTMLAMLQNLGVTPSFSRPAVSDDNPYSEALFRTLKYHPTFPMLDKFSTVIDARSWCEKFVTWYNNEHLHSALKFITPQQRHTGADKLIMKRRHRVYQAAKERYPERWSGNIRNWHLPESVTLNPGRKNNKSKDEILQAA